MMRHCHNCKSTVRPIKRSGFCSRCLYWHTKAERLRRLIHSPAQVEKNGRGTNAASLKYRLRAAVRVLEELRWRETGRAKDCVDSYRIRSLIYALADKSRTSVDEASVAKIQDLPIRSRRVLHDIVLSMVENLPTRRPVLRRERGPLRPSLHDGGWIEWGREYWLLTSSERQELDRACLDAKLTT